MSSDESDTRVRILEATWRLMEAGRGQGVRMSDIAKAAGISRQAVYLHFESRTDLMIATTRYVDEVKGLNDRLAAFQEAATGEARLEALVDVWGHYIPEIFGIAKALMVARETDAAAAAAWKDVMGCLDDAGRAVIDALASDGVLADDWRDRAAAADMVSTLISIDNWERLTVENGWSTARYVDGMKTVLRRTFVKGAK